MKKYLLIIIILLSVNLYSQDKQIVKSKITKVKVYNSGAMIEREAVFIAKKGVSTIYFKGVPDFLDKKTVIISGKTSKDAKVIDYNFYPEEYYDNSYDYSIEKIKLISNKFNSDIIKHNNRIEYFNQLKNGIKKSVTKEFKNIIANDLNNIQNLCFEGESNEIQKINIINDSLKIYSNKLRQLKKEQKRAVVIPKQTIIVNIKASKAVKNHFIIRYFIKNTGWIPFYNIDINPETRKADLKQYASIYQVTGEDWNDVEITISNEIPITLTSIPNLNYKYLSLDSKNRLGNKNYKLISSENSKKKEFIIDGFKTLKEEKKFTLPNKYSLASGNPNLKIKYNEKKIIAYYEDQIDLSIDTRINYHTSIVNNTHNVIQAGNVNLFLNGRFKGKDIMQNLTPDDSISYVLGKNNSIGVLKTILIDRKNESGIFNKEIVKIKSIEYKLKNNGLKQRDIKLIDFIPYSTNTNVKIRLYDKKWNHNRNNGNVEYKIHLNPKEEKSITLKFEIKYPEDEFY